MVENPTRKIYTYASGRDIFFWAKQNSPLGGEALRHVTSRCRIRGTLYEECTYNTLFYIIIIEISQRGQRCDCTEIIRRQYNICDTTKRAHAFRQFLLSLLGSGGEAKLIFTCLARRPFVHFGGFRDFLAAALDPVFREPRRYAKNPKIEKFQYRLQKRVQSK